MTWRGSIHAFTLWGATEAEQKEIHAGLAAGLENGTLRPIVGKELPLAEARRAHKEILAPGCLRQNCFGFMKLKQERNFLPWMTAFAKASRSKCSVRD